MLSPIHVLVKMELWRSGRDMQLADFTFSLSVSTSALVVERMRCCSLELWIEPKVRVLDPVVTSVSRSSIAGGTIGHQGNISKGIRSRGRQLQLFVPSALWLHSSAQFYHLPSDSQSSNLDVLPQLWNAVGVTSLHILLIISSSRTCTYHAYC